MRSHRDISIITKQMPMSGGECNDCSNNRWQQSLEVLQQQIIIIIWQTDKVLARSRFSWV